MKFGVAQIPLGVARIPTVMEINLIPEVCSEIYET